MNPLQTLIREQMRRKGWSYEQVEARAREAGFPISSATVHTLATRKHLRRAPAEELLRALAAGLDLPLPALQMAAAEAMGWTLYYERTPEQEIWIAAIDELTPDQQEHIKRTIELYREQNERGDDR